MAPRVLAIDELGDNEEMHMLEVAGASGCRILATIHAESIEDMLSKEYMHSSVKSGFFKRYVLMGKVNGVPGVIEVYGERMNLLC